MKTQTYTLAGDTVSVRFAETEADADEAIRWCASQRLLAFDTEGTHLRQFSPQFRVRLTQFGNQSVAYVLPVERDAWSFEASRVILAASKRMIGFNVPFDAIAAMRAGLISDAMELQHRMVDAGLVSRLVDPRRKGEGGAVGNRQEEVAAAYVDPKVTELEDELHAEFHRLGFLKDNKKNPEDLTRLGYAQIPVDNEIYWKYAGLDTILLSRLFPPVYKELQASPAYHLLQFEREVQAEVMRVEIKGALINQEYAADLSDELSLDHEARAKVAAQYGVANVNSTAQVSAALLAMGEDIPERTDSGQVKVDKAVLCRLADVNIRDWDEQLETRKPNPLAAAVQYAKRAGKWKGTYADAMRNGVDENGRLHAKFNSLQARTARMSVSGPPLQQIPGKDKRIRPCIHAAPRHVLVSADYSAVEFCILAAVADIRVIKEVIATGEDLHNRTGKLIHGDDFEDLVLAGDPWAKKQRDGIKVTTYCTCYGGGATAISQQTGLPLLEARRVHSAFLGVYPEIKKTSNAYQREAMLSPNHSIITPTGRVLPVDRDRSYSALNYVIQSTARDVFADALLRLRDEGMSDKIILLVHDEIVCEVPEDEAADYAKRLGEVMSTTVLDVPITAEGEILGPHWRKGS